MRQFATMFVLIFLLIMIFSHETYAYIDPGTGSFLFQILIASVLSALFTLKLWFRTVKRFLLRLFGVAGNTITKTGEPNGESIETNSLKGSAASAADKELKKKP